MASEEHTLKHGFLHRNMSTESHALQDNIAMHNLMLQLGVITPDAVKQVEEAAGLGIALVLTGVNVNENALAKATLTKIDVGSGFHNGWIDGGYTWTILKVPHQGEGVVNPGTGLLEQPGDKFALMAAFDVILPCELKELTAKLCELISNKIKTCYISAHIHLPKPTDVFIRSLYEAISELEVKGNGSTYEELLAFVNKKCEADAKAAIADQKQAGVLVDALENLATSVKNITTVCKGREEEIVPIFRFTTPETA